MKEFIPTGYSAT